MPVNMQKKAVEIPLDRKILLWFPSSLRINKRLLFLSLQSSFLIQNPFQKKVVYNDLFTLSILKVVTLVFCLANTKNSIVTKLPV